MVGYWNLVSRVIVLSMFMIGIMQLVSGDGVMSIIAGVVWIGMGVGLLWGIDRTVSALTERVSGHP